MTKREHNERECGLTYRREDLDPENPYVGPQDDDPVTAWEFLPVVVSLAVIILIFILIV